MSKHTEGLVEVSREEFFAYVGPRNIHPRCTPDCTYWETPNRQVVGTTPGYRNSAARLYRLTSEARAAIAKAEGRADA